MLPITIAKSMSIIERVKSIHIYTYRDPGFIFLMISPACILWIYKLTGWAIIEELTIRRQVHTFLISWGQKTRVKHCCADLSSCYEFWFEMICIDMNVISDLSTAIQQFQRRFRLSVNVSIPTALRILFIEMQWQGIILAPICLC